MIKRIINKLKELQFNITKTDPITGIRIPPNKKVIYGNPSAIWTIPENILTQGSICYLVGAGEDISFDCAVAEKYQCKVFILDPTPRAISHFEKVKKSGVINDSVISLIKFLPVGLWKENTTLKFYAPEKEEYVSHSVVNLQKTERYFEAQVKTLATFMKENGQESIDLLKIDIEGAEYEVIKSIIKDKIFPKILCVEFDETFHPLDDHHKERINESLNLLLNSGYKLFNLDYPGNYTLIKQE